jgi:MFS family permease
MFAALQFVGGVLTDRFGEKPVMSLAVALTLVGSLLVFYSPTYTVFVLSVLVVGVGSGMFFVSASTFISRQFTDIGGKIGLLTLGGSVAGLVAPVVAVSLSEWAGGPRHSSERSVQPCCWS